MAHVSARQLAVGLYLSAAAMFLGSCSSSSSAAKEHTFEVSVVDGVTHAVSSSVPKYSEPLFEYEEVLWLNQDYDRPESLLNRASGFLIGDDERYYVTDYGDNRIAVYDSDGEYLHSIGREGEGPGEFQFPQILWVKDGELAVYDPGLRRTIHFSTDGTFLKTQSYLQVDYNVYQIHPLGDRLVLVGADPDMSNNNEEMFQCPFVMVISTEGDTLSRVEAAPYSFGRRVQSTSSGLGTTARTYFSMTSIATFQPGLGIFCCRTDEPVIRWFDLDGELRREIRCDLEPEPVTDEERKGILHTLQNRIDEAVDDRRREIYELSKKHAVIPDDKTCWSSMFVDDYGYHWLMCHTDYSIEDSAERRPRYRLLSPEGEYLGNGQHPEQYGQISRGCFLTSREDEETGEVLQVVYCLVPAAAGFTYP